MSRTVESTVYRFDELSDTAKERARDWWRNCAEGDDWYDSIYEDASSIAKILGIEFDQKPVKLMGGATRYNPCIWFSGFCSQGDGACFESRYSYAKGAKKAIREYASQDETLHRIADDLQDIQRRNFYRLEAKTRHSGRYYHSGCMNVEVFNKESGNEICGDSEKDLTTILRRFADWIYKQLVVAYDYYYSDENVDESMRLNEYEFTEEGKLTA